MMGLTVFSYGGGVQSNAALVLAAQGDLDCRTFLFANVGDDSENPATLRYVREIAMPYAAAHGIDLIEVQRHTHDGSPETLLGRITNPRLRSIGIPVRMSNGAPGNRSCTADFKIKVVSGWLYRRGARAKNPATVMLGISLDEWQRMKDSQIGYTRNAYPLIERRMSRQDCVNVIADAGLPIPPKSSCWFCPFHRPAVWREMRDKEPDQFRKAVELERFINQRRAYLGKDQVWLSRALKPLDRAVGNASQPSLFDDECAGYCMV